MLQLHKTTFTYSESKFSDIRALHKSEYPEWKATDYIPLTKAASQRNLDQTKNQSIKLFLHYNSVTVLNSYITYVHGEIPEVIFSKFLPRSEFKALEIIAIS